MSTFAPKTIVIFCSLLIFVCAEGSRSQDTKQLPEPGLSFSAQQNALCTKQQLSPGRQRAYNFRELLPEYPVKGAYGKKPWYGGLTKLIPFLRSGGTAQYAENDIRTIRSGWGRPVAVGESKRSQQIRLSAKEKLLAIQNQGEKNWQEWLAKNPDSDEKEKMKAAIRLQGLAAANLSAFNWRDFGLNVGEVGFQGFLCDTCWAFTTVDAMQISRRLLAMRSNNSDLDETLRPSVRQLLSCMLPKPSDPNDPKNYCAMNWSGQAFSYMVDEGLPLGGASKYGRDKFDWECSPEVRVKALTWDFVSPVPQNVSATKDMKEAIILYGALAAPMRFDDCIYLYGDGVFNEEQPDNKNYHYVLILGWDDSKNNGRGAWLIKNSYGKEWGENGFGWVEYGSNAIGTFAAFVVPDPKEEDRIANYLKQSKN